MKNGVVTLNILLFRVAILRANKIFIKSSRILNFFNFFKLIIIINKKQKMDKDLLTKYLVESRNILKSSVLGVPEQLMPTED